MKNPFKAQWKEYNDQYNCDLWGNKMGSTFASMVTAKKTAGNMERHGFKTRIIPMKKDAMEGQRRANPNVMFGDRSKTPRFKLLIKKISFFR